MISSSPEEPDDPVIRILLMGRKGSGKSSSGNTILGETRFKVQTRKRKHETRDESEVCEEKAQIKGKQVVVIDCPDLLDPDLSKEKLEELKQQLVSRCSAGLSAVLLTVPLEETVQNEEEIVYFMKCLFGPEVQKYIMILFTKGDELEEQTVVEYLQNDNEDLQQLVTEFGEKFHCFNNKNKSDDQIQELLHKIEGMMEENGGKFIMEQERRSSKDNPDAKFSAGSSAEDADEIDAIPERTDQIRLVLLGKTGSGKSATANTIIGRNLFKSSGSSKSQTKQCQSETTVRIGKNISVIDTPGLYDTALTHEEVIAEIVKCLTLASPGPHAFIIVIKVGRFTDEEKNTIEKLKEVFGEKIEKYAVIIFTHKDLLEDEANNEEFVKEGDLQSVVHSCGNRYFFFNNKSASLPQFKTMISTIEKMLEENGGTHFTNEMFDETEKHIKEIQKQKLNQKVKQYKLRNKGGILTEWQKVYWSLIIESRQEAEQEVICDVDIPVASAARLLGNMVVTEETRKRAIKEAESLGISQTKAAQLAVRATEKLLSQNMCGVQ